MARTVFRLVLSTLVILGLTAGTSAAANKEHQQMMADIRMLQEQGQRLQLQIAALTEALKTISAKIDEQTSANRKLFADQKLVIDSMVGDLRVVREKADDNSVRLGTLSQDLEALRQSVAQQAPQSATPAQPVPGAPAAGGQPVTPPQTPPSGAPDAIGMAPTQLYERANSDFMQGNYDLAIQGFSTYLKAFPRSSQAPDAQYYIGESHFGAGRFDLARDAYTKVINDYSSSTRVPEAYYKLGLTFERLNDRAHARDAYQTVIDKFPNSEAATLAKQRLSRLQGPGDGDEEHGDAGVDAG